MGMLKCVIYRYLNSLSVENRWASLSFFYKSGDNGLFSMLRCSQSTHTCSTLKKMSIRALSERVQLFSVAIARFANFSAAPLLVLVPFMATIS